MRSDREDRRQRAFGEKLEVAEDDDDEANGVADARHQR
jgi:hypothetical protein